MKDLYKRIYDKLPYTWEMVTLNQYNQLQSIVPANDSVEVVEQLDNNLKLIAALSGELEETVATLPYKYIVILSDKIKFLRDEINTSGKSTLKFKDADKLTYDEYVTVSKVLEHPSTNFAPVLKAILLDKTIDIGELSIVEVMRGFFLQQKLYNRLLKRSLLYLPVKLMVVLMKEKIQVFFNKTKQKH